MAIIESWFQIQHPRFIVPKYQFLNLLTSAPPIEVDSDGDGVPDNEDAFPYDSSETKDSDGDGVGDNGDVHFPNEDSSETKDSDGDGVGNNADVFPNNPSETKDSDSDGVGDNADAFPNNSSETKDSDGDLWGIIQIFSLMIHLNHQFQPAISKKLEGKEEI